MPEPQTHCPICGTYEWEQNPGDFYHRVDCDKRAAFKLVREAVERGASVAEIHKLKQAAFDAGECGD